MEAAADLIEGVLHLALGALLVPAYSLYTMFIYAIVGLMFGAVAQLYRRHVIL